jgi:hypothetical protein
MARYTVHVPESGTSMGPLSALGAFNKVRELRSLGFRSVTLKNVDTDEEITDVESLVRDSPEA